MTTRASDGILRDRGPAGTPSFVHENEKRAVRRTILKAIAIPGHFIPHEGGDLPLPSGWGTGGIRLTASIAGSRDVLKVIDQGTDEATNASSIRRFFQSSAGLRVTKKASEATLIQSRHRIPETPLHNGQVLILQVPLPDPLRTLVRSELERRRLHGNREYGLMFLKLYEDVTRYGTENTAFAHPVRVNGHYVVSPSPIPRFDNPKLNRSAGLILFGAGTDGKIYAIPPYTDVASLAFDDRPFHRGVTGRTCLRCGATDSYLDEVFAADGTAYACSDTDYCEQRRDAAAAKAT